VRTKPRWGDARIENHPLMKRQWLEAEKDKCLHAGRNLFTRILQRVSRLAWKRPFLD
jgi:hypothetical protein